MLNMIHTSELNFNLSLYVWYFKFLFGFFFKFNLRYTRNLIDKGNGKYNLILLCWGESQGSSIHDHSNSHCFVKMLDGELVETLYEWPKENPDASSQEMKPISKSFLRKNEVAYINGKWETTK